LFRSPKAACILCAGEQLLWCTQTGWRSRGSPSADRNATAHLYLHVMCVRSLENRTINLYNCQADKSNLGAGSKSVRARINHAPLAMAFLLIDGPRCFCRGRVDSRRQTSAMQQIFNYLSYYWLACARQIL